jgi:P-type Cu2+ transporter
MTPANKIAYVAELRAHGRNVLMVGDGLNDAPSLAAADASMSPVTAAHVTQTAADAVFLSGRLSPLAEAVAIARKAKRVMRENLCLAVVYNIIAVRSPSWDLRLRWSPRSRHVRIFHFGHA